MKKYIILILVTVISTTIKAETMASFDAYVTPHKNELIISQNIYFSLSNKGTLEDFTIENHDNLQRFTLNRRDVEIESLGGRAVLGKIDQDLENISTRTKVKIQTNLEAKLVFSRNRLPKIEQTFICELTGCGIKIHKVSRNQRVISLKNEDGVEFCLYQNIENKINQLLYVESCKIK